MLWEKENAKVKIIYNIFKCMVYKVKINNPKTTNYCNYLCITHHEILGKKLYRTCTDLLEFVAAKFKLTLAFV